MNASRYFRHHFLFAMLERHPEEHALRQRIEHLRHEHADVLHELFVLQHDTYRELTQRYAVAFGTLEKEIQQRTVELAELQRRLELFSIRKSKGQIFDDDTIRFVNDMVTREFQVYYESLRENFERSSAERDAKRATPLRKEKAADSTTQYEIRTLYRTLVRRLHPDLSNEGDRFEKFWQLVQEAYAQADLTRLRHLHGLLCTDSATFVDSSEHGSLESLREEVRRRDMQVDYERRKLARIQGEEPFSLQSMLDNDVLHAEHKQKLSKHLERLERQILNTRSTLQELLGHAWELATEAMKAEPGQPDCQEEFRLNTYFSMRA